jgi:hypothetical protein
MASTIINSISTKLLDPEQVVRLQDKLNTAQSMQQNAELAIDNFDKNVSHYYYLKSVEQDLLSSQSLTNKGNTSEDIANELLNTLVSEPRQMLLKLNIMENELANDMDCATPVGRRHLMLFAALKADLITLLAELG